MIVGIWMCVCECLKHKREPEKNGDTITRSTAACEFICMCVCARVCLGNQSRFIAIVIYILDAVCVSMCANVVYVCRKHVTGM